MVEADTTRGQVKAGPVVSRRMERLLLAVLLLIFCAFTWKSTQMYFSGDDLMNTYEWAWMESGKRILAALVSLWMPLYRPLGEGIYKVWYANWDFQPFPLYLFGWLLVVANVLAAYRMFKAVLASVVAALIGLTAVLVHGAYMELYNSTGTNFDRLVFLFSCLAMASYAHMRRESEGIPVWRIAWIWFLCAMAMDSKESGVVVPVLLGVYELLIVLPGVLRRTSVGQWLMSITPLFVVLGLSCAAFLFGRVARTPATLDSANYHPQVSFEVWSDHMAQYLSMLVYGQLKFTPLLASMSLAGLLVLAMALRRRIMIFGWLWFVISMLPVAMITMRPGYALYAPALGLGLYAGDLLTWVAQPAIVRFPRAVVPALLVLIGAMTSWHVRHWQGFMDPTTTPIFRLANQLQHEYPTLPRGAKVLFVTDTFAKDSWETTFLLRLLYHDPTIEVRRMDANPEQQPAKDAPLNYDLVLAAAGGRYEELDGRNIDESIRLHILKNLSVGRRMRLGNRDHGAYVISGIEDYEGSDDGRWTKPTATLKFDVYPADSTLSVTYFVPDEVVQGSKRTLSARVNGRVVGSAQVSSDGLQTLRFAVPAAAISPQGFTILELTVDPPYKAPSGSELGVLLMEAGFDYTAR